jgi:hypothetical protein
MQWPCSPSASEKEVILVALTMVAALGLFARREA